MPVRTGLTRAFLRWKETNSFLRCRQRIPTGTCIFLNLPGIKKAGLPFIITTSSMNGGISLKGSFYLRWATRYLQQKQATVFLVRGWYRMHLEEPGKALPEC